MQFAFIFKGILMGLIVSVPLGPVGVMCIQRTINRGLKSGIISGIGAAADRHSICHYCYFWIGLYH